MVSITTESKEIIHFDGSYTFAFLFTQEGQTSNLSMFSCSKKWMPLTKKSA